MIRKLIQLMTVLLGLFLVSCQVEQSCRENTDVLLQSGFYSYSSKESLKVDSLSVQGIGNDSILYNNKKSIALVALPLKELANETEYSLNINGIKDTLTINHQNQEYFLSFECGSVIIYDLTGVTYTKHAVDSISVVDNTVNNAQKENIRIFY